MIQPIKINHNQSYAMTLVVLAERSDNRRLATVDPVKTRFQAETGQTSINPATYQVLIEKNLVRWDSEQSGVVATVAGAAYVDGVHSVLKGLR